MLPINSQVALRSFNGTASAPSDCRQDENYWLLIGEVGTVVETINTKARVLVKFDRPVSEHGLCCHNPVPNSLYILETDLRKMR